MKPTLPVMIIIEASAIDQCRYIPCSCKRAAVSFFCYFNCDWRAAFHFNAEHSSIWTMKHIPEAHTERDTRYSSHATFRFLKTFMLYVFGAHEITRFFRFFSLSTLRFVCVWDQFSFAETIEKQSRRQYTHYMPQSNTTVRQSYSWQREERERASERCKLCIVLR